MPYVPPMPEESLPVKVFDHVIRTWLVTWWSLLDIAESVYRRYHPRPDLSCDCDDYDDEDDSTVFCWECGRIREESDTEPQYQWLKLCHRWGLETTYRCRDREFCVPLPLNDE